MNDPLLVGDLLQRLGQLSDQGALADARKHRDAATRHTQGSYDALFGEHAEDLPLRLRLAGEVAWVSGDNIVAAHYRERLQALGDNRPSPAAAWLPVQAYGLQVAVAPAVASAATVQALVRSGWSLAQTIGFAQTIAFVSFQSRLLTGLRAIEGHQTAAPATPEAVAGQWDRHAWTGRGSPAPTAFTQDELEWEPWLPPRAAETYLPSERAVMDGFSQLNSDYFNLLGYNVPVLEQRTLTDHGIFYTSGGLARAERELLAAVTSKVNGCIFCASVHARKAGQLSKREAQVQQLLDTAEGEVLTLGQETRWRALIDASARLAATPSRFTADTVAALRAQGLDALQLLDLVQSTAFFSWANRLMLTLGEPRFPSVVRTPV